MRNGHRANALLVELLLVIFFFMIASVTLVQLFGAAKTKSTTARAMNAAMLESQNIAEDLYAAENAEDAEKILADLGFENKDGIWSREDSLYRLQISRGEEKTAAGTLRTWTIQALQGEETLITLPSARYFPEEVSP